MARYALICSGSPFASGLPTAIAEKWTQAPGECGPHDVAIKIFRFLDQYVNGISLGINPAMSSLVVVVGAADAERIMRDFRCLLVGAGQRDKIAVRIDEGLPCGAAKVGRVHLRIAPKIWISPTMDEPALRAWERCVHYFHVPAEGKHQEMGSSSAGGGDAADVLVLTMAPPLLK